MRSTSPGTGPDSHRPSGQPGQPGQHSQSDSTPRPSRPTVESAVEQLATAVKPLLRGWIHAGMFPFVLVAGIVLVAISPTPTARWSSLVFAVATALLFGASAVYHRGTWEPRTLAILRRIDHSNIFLVIAGTYTPLAALLLPPAQSRTLLLVVWGGAVAGILTRVFWLGAPRWLYVPIYLALSWVAVWFLPSFGRSGGEAVMWLVIVGGIGYTLGAVVYALKRPNPSPRWFGFHEIFHVGTLIGYTCHAIAIYLVVLSLR